MIESPLSRRLMLERSAGVAAGALLGVGGTSWIAPAPAVSDPQGRRLARVHVSPDRGGADGVGAAALRPAGFVVRAERLDGKTVVHNYGHGGDGISLSRGNSALAVELAQQT